MKFVKTFALGAAAVALGGVAFAQNSNTANATASASVDVVQPISIQGAPEFALNDAFGTPIDTVIAGAEISGSANVVVIGEPGATYDVALGGGSNELTLTGPGPDIVLDLDPVAEQTLDVSGNDNFDITVAAGEAIVTGQPSGTYTGSVAVTVTYN